MGAEQSVPRHRLKPTKYGWHDRGVNLARGKQWRTLYWAVLCSNKRVTTLNLEIDVAVCFGDVARVLVMLQQDDAELDHHRDEAGEDRLDSHLLPPGYERLRFADGCVEPLSDGSKLPVIVFAGGRMEHTQQICEHSGLERHSTLHVAMPRPRNTWLAMPRLRRCGLAYGCFAWTLPQGWNDGLSEVLANYDSVEIRERYTHIANNLAAIHQHADMRLVKPLKRSEASPVTWITIDALDLGGNKGDGWDAFVAVAAPRDSIYNYRHEEPHEFIIHVQFPSMYPIAPARLRMLTPIVHPLVKPFWPSMTEYEGEMIHKAPLDAGRIAYMGNHHPSNDGSVFEVLAELHEAMAYPVQCAELLMAHLRSQERENVEQWLVEDQEQENGMITRARAWMRLVSGRARWTPDMHFMCPQRFKLETRTLLMVWRRVWTGMPAEIVWLIIDALLRTHLVSPLIYDCTPFPHALKYGVRYLDHILPPVPVQGVHP